jgi:hypothetical protein
MKHGGRNVSVRHRESQRILMSARARIDTEVLAEVSVSADVGTTTLARCSAAAVCTARELAFTTIAM